jgi:hypothetical protein
MCSKIIPTLPKFETTPVGWYIPGHRLYKKPYFDTIGYWDVNYYPLYCLDLDYSIRAKLLHQACVVVNSSFCFEFWSRALYEGVVPVKDMRRMDYFRDKWGQQITDWSGYTVPFNGSFPNKYKGYDTSQIKISTRTGELERIKSLMGSSKVVYG